MKKILQYFSNQKALISKVQDLSTDLAYTKSAAIDIQNELKDRHKLFISQYDNKSFISIVDVNADIKAIIQIPALKYHELRKAGVQVIDKNILND